MGGKKIFVNLAIGEEIHKDAENKKNKYIDGDEFENEFDLKIFIDEYDFSFIVADHLFVSSSMAFFTEFTIGVSRL
jgi:hypothetical protein